MPMLEKAAAFEELNRRVTTCTRCSRLVEYRQRVALKKRRMYQHSEYWGRPLPGFGDPQARAMILGLAPAAHGGNRTGRMFTGDRSGEWVYGTLHRFGFASLPNSLHRDDGLTLHDVYITAAVRCVPPDNKPLPEEQRACRPYLLEELSILQRLQVVVALGRLAFDTYLSVYREQGAELPSPRPQFVHGAATTLPNGVILLASYHPSQRNTQTGRLTAQMFDDVFATLRQLLGNR